MRITRAGLNSRMISMLMSAGEKPGVVEVVETPLAVALRVVGSLRSPFAPTNPTYHLLRSEGAPMGPDPSIGRGMAASAPPDKSRSHVSCPCALVEGVETPPGSCPQGWASRREVFPRRWRTSPSSLRGLVDVMKDFRDTSLKAFAA